MAVSIIWRPSNTGSPITNVDHGAGGNGDILAEQEVYIEHDGVNDITQCKFWISEKSGGYTGSFSASIDLAEMVSWGDGATSAAFGGFQISMDDGVSWPTYTDKGATGGGDADYFVARTGYGDSAANGVELSSSMNSTPAMTGNTIPDSCTIWPHFKSRIQIPTDESETGVRQFDLKLRYTYTS